ncbi:GTP pyrophosphokinase family protein [Robertmurraya sp. DFI.2.37]|uniref:GTP pyrophosphokinase n=1 Tax=Robertmurraya sp. DFI.2.37 TaxID=3031819 RepID=UPI001CD9FAAF|nr:GTP pyrophosphokinase family protein [Robertmurraya sp. DFI.2.37]MDF1511436.1 GTP pyrophosphokinase family protein [Robertmurraya sp. DFI.2.37]
MDMTNFKNVKVELTRFMMAYKFALDEMNTKINILKEEFNYIHDYNPIEHVSSRVKSPESIFKKMYRKGYPFSLSSIKENIKDIAGIRITCSFISDIYEISNMLQQQKDITLLACKDYISNPKPNGYQSLHLILEIPIFMSDREELIPVEIQIRTIAMDFWASLEHKIFYKYNKEVPEKLIMELKDAATVASELDRKMERIHQEMAIIKETNRKKENEQFLLNMDEQTLQISKSLLETFTK